MDSALLIHRLHFAFTVTFHYLFPQLTMGLALLIVVLKTLALRTHKEICSQAARFWAKIFGINFVLGVVTGIPMEFQFGTNWSHFARVTGGVIGQPLVIFMLVGAAAAVYPNLLISTIDPARNITVYNAAVGHYALSYGLIWWSLGMVLAVGYFVLIYRMFRGKVAA